MLSVPISLHFLGESWFGFFFPPGTLLRSLTKRVHENGIKVLVQTINICSCRIWPKFCGNQWEWNGINTVLGLWHKKLLAQLQCDLPVQIPCSILMWCNLSNTRFLEKKTNNPNQRWNVSSGGRGGREIDLQIEIKLVSTEFIKLNSAPPRVLQLTSVVLKQVFPQFATFFSFLTCRRCTKAAETWEYSLSTEI